jgi:hypothetical protein
MTIGAGATWLSAGASAATSRKEGFSGGSGEISVGLSLDMDRYRFAALADGAIQLGSSPAAAGREPQDSARLNGQAKALFAQKKLAWLPRETPQRASQNANLPT